MNFSFLNAYNLFIGGAYGITALFLIGWLILNVWRYWRIKRTLKIFEKEQ